jgi:ATP-dependent RNA helicase HelY
MDSIASPAQKFAAASARKKYQITAEFIETFDFPFDPFQIAACNAVEDGKGVLVAAPTGAGKTVVGEFASIGIFTFSKYFPLMPPAPRAKRAGPDFIF